MLTLTLRSAMAHRGRLALTVFAVALSVSFVAASFILADTLRSTFGDVSDTIYRGVDAEVRAGTGDYDELVTGDRFNLADLDAIAAIEGVEEVAPILGARNEIFSVDTSGEVLRQGGPPTLSFSSVGRSDASAFTFLAGEPPEAGEVALDTAQARVLGVSIGDPVQVATSIGVESFELSGLVVFGEDESGISPYFLVFELGTMQRLVNTPGQIDSASLLLDGSTDSAGVLDSVRQVLPDGLTIVEQSELIDEQNSEFGEVIGLIQTALLVFAGLTIFVSTFVIANTFAVLIGQQRHQIGLLRAVGASGRQTTGLIVGEALLVGLVASLVGLGGGFLVAEGIKALVASVTDGGFPPGATRFLPRTALLGIGVGVGVTAISALIPAVRASRVSPLEAMASGEPDAASNAIGIRAMRRLASLSVGWMGAAGRLAAASVSRNPKRVLVTAMSMIVGLTVIGAMTVLTSSYRATISDLAANAYDADVVVSGTDGVLVPYKAMDAVLALDAVEAASGFGDVEVLSDGNVVSIEGYQSSTAEGVVVFETLAGRSASLSQSEAVVTTDWADTHNLELGSKISIEFSDGARFDLEVVGISEDSSVLAADVLVDATLIASHARNVDANFGAIRFTAGSDQDSALQATRVALSDFPQLTVETLAEHVATQETQAQQFLAIANGLLGLTIVVALIGIANTVALSMMERRNEIGLLRAVGMSRRQLRRMVRIEALVMSLVGVTIGLTTGVAIAVITVRLVPDTLIDQLRVPLVSLAIYAAVGGAFGVLAAALPARRASQMSVLDAISPS